MKLKHCLIIKLFKLLIYFDELLLLLFFWYLIKCLHEFYKLFIKYITNKSDRS